MSHRALQRMSGEELLLNRILLGASAAGAIDAELDRRALHGQPAATRASRAAATVLPLRPRAVIKAA